MHKNAHAQECTCTEIHMHKNAQAQQPLLRLACHKSVSSMSSTGAAFDASLTLPAEQGFEQHVLMNQNACDCEMKHAVGSCVQG